MVRHPRAAATGSEPLSRPLQWPNGWKSLHAAQITGMEIRTWVIGGTGNGPIMRELRAYGSFHTRSHRYTSP